MTYINNYAIGSILCLQTISHCVILTVGQYIYTSYLQIYSNASNLTTTTLHQLHIVDSSNSKQCPDSLTNSSGNNAQLWAQEQSADLFFRINLWNSCPMIIMTYILGFYTPKLGRQFVLILPMLGTSIQFSIWLAIIYFHLNDYWWYIASFIVGLSGSNYILNFVLSLLIMDNTNESNRSIRFVLFEALTTFVSAIVTFAIGYYINWRGFTDLYWISLSLQILSIIIVILFFKNSSNTINERTSLLSSSVPTDIDIQIKESNSCKNCLNIFKIFNFNNRSRRKSLCLLLTLFAYIFYLLAYSTYASFLWYLLDSPFCWSSENYGTYTAVASISSAIFSLVGMKLFTYLKFNDILICTISHLFFAGSSLWIALAKYSWQLYAGLLISPYADYQNSLTLPIMTKWLQPYEINHGFTLVAEVNTIITTFGDSIFNWIYAKTVAHFKNFTLLLAVGFSIISFLLNLCLLGVNSETKDEYSPLVSEIEPNVLPQNDILCPSSSLLSIPNPNSQSSTNELLIV